jgi:hypothetical protein
VPISHYGRIGSGLGVVACSSVVLAMTASAGAQSSATVTFRGGDATDIVDCVNLSDSEAKQRNRCDARAEGGAADLRNVDIHIRSGGAIKVNGGTVDVVAVGGGDADAGAICINEAGRRVDAKQINLCRARAVGGKAKFEDVQIVVHQANGKTTTRRRDLVALRAPAARADVNCARESSATSCGAGAGGGNVEMRNVDMVDRSTGRTRSGVSVSVLGGKATAKVTCGNYASDVRIQINKCTARATGGNAILRGVRIHVYER